MKRALTFVSAAFSMLALLMAIAFSPEAWFASRTDKDAMCIFAFIIISVYSAPMLEVIPPWIWNFKMAAVWLIDTVCVLMVVAVLIGFPAVKDLFHSGGRPGLALWVGASQFISILHLMHFVPSPRQRRWLKDREPQSAG